MAGLTAITGQGVGPQMLPGGSHGGVQLPPRPESENALNALLENFNVGEPPSSAAPPSTGYAVATPGRRPPLGSYRSTQPASIYGWGFPAVSNTTVISSLGCPGGTHPQTQS